MAKRQLFQMFLKFILTQLTILITVEELNRIVQYSFIDFNYQIQGPYLLKTSRIPANTDCHQFYNPKFDLVHSLGVSYTHTQFMNRISSITLRHNQGIEVPLAALAFIIGIIIELIGFVNENTTVVLLDNMFTLLLPHFTLFINTVTWGDLCIQNSDIFMVIDYEIMAIIPLITVSWITLMVILMFMIVGCQISLNSFWVFLYACLLCLLFLYLITVDMISFYCSPQLVLKLFQFKFAVMAVLLCSMFKVF